MKLDISVWDNIERLRIACANNARVLASFTVANVFTMLYYKNWFLMGINIIGFITAMMTIISKIKFDKNYVPK